MSLFGALFTSVSGLSAQSQATAMISNNIANVDTVGFKSDDAAFYSLVTTSTSGGAYNPGTVTVNTVQNVNLQGAIQQTSSSTDAAISGNGFFVVKQVANADQPYLYTRSGSFTENATGQLVNSAGDVLYGWPLSSNGSLPANEGDLSSLQPVNVAFLGGLTKPTTTADVSLNLNASEVDNNGAVTSPPTALPFSTTTTPADFTRALTVYDSLGSPQNLTIQMRKVVGPMANATSGTGNLALTTSLTDTSVFGNVTAGNSFSVTTGTPASTQTFTVVAASTGVTGQVATVGDLINQINAMGGGAAVTASLDSSGRLLIQADNPASTLTLANVTGTPLGTGKSPAGDVGTLNIAGQPGVATATVGNLAFTPQAPVQGTGNPPVYSATDTYPTQGDYPTIANVTDPNPSGWWEATILKPDGTVESQGLLNFDGGGNLNAAPDANGTVGINLQNINWGNGANLSNIDIDVSKVTQFAGQYNVVSTDQNGAALGLRTGVEIEQDGTVEAQFSNGATASLYKLPMATFSDPDGLLAQSGTAYSETSQSGTVNLREAGTGGAGLLQSSSLEGSNVDLADEFGKLIVSQNAYTADTKVITTIDDMTQDLLRIAQ